MANGFLKGLMIGGIVGASAKMMMNPAMMKNRTRRRILRTGRNFYRKSSNIFGDIVGMFR